MDYYGARGTCGFSHVGCSSVTRLGQHCWDWVGRAIGQMIVAETDAELRDLGPCPLSRLHALEEAFFLCA